VDDIARLDTGVPHIARVYDYCLGGKDNFAADREAAKEFIKAMPDIVHGVREARAFLARAVGFLAGDEQVAKFLDGLRVLEPGLVQYPRWRPEPGSSSEQPVSAWCAVARKP